MSAKDAVAEPPGPRPASPAELAQIAAFNDTGFPFPDNTTLHALIEARFAAHPERVAVWCDHDKTLGTPSLSCAELNARANQLARHLRAQGVTPGQVVGLQLERSFAMMIGVLAILKAGGAYLPIPPGNPPARTRYMLEDAQVRILLVHAGTVGKAEFGGTVLNLDDAALYSGEAADLPAVNQPEDLAYVIYTSGSTGKPKGVMVEHRSVVNRLHWMQHAYPIGAGDIILQKTPYYFDVSVWELFWWALEGAALCFLAPGGERMPVMILDAIRKHGVSVLHFVPSMLNVFLEYLDGKPERVRQSLGSVRQVFVSGEALAPSHVAKFNHTWASYTGARLTNLYGPTEATVDVTYFDCPPGEDIPLVPIGKPIHNTRMYVLREGRPLGIGEAGELCIAGVGLARGYLNNAALTAEKFVTLPGPPAERVYRTGDVARWLPDGNIEYLGREDFQVKIRGLRIELGEIENTIREFPAVSDCVCTVRQYSEHVILIIAYLVGKPGLRLEELKQHLRAHLPDYCMPGHFAMLEEIPLTPTGKADRKRLPEPVLQVGTP